MRPARHILLQVVVTIFFIGCSCDRNANKPAPEYYSGIFHIDESGRTSFTDCATRIEMDIESDGRYEQLRRDYDGSEAGEGRQVRIELYGSLVKSGPDTGRDAVLPVPQNSPRSRIAVRVDSLLSLCRDAACLSDYIVAGFYRRIHEGEAEILRLRPDYTYTIENFSTSNNAPLSDGRWYRTSELTLELAPSSGNETVPFQIVPAQESITGTGGGEVIVYKKEWL